MITSFSIEDESCGAGYDPGPSSCTYPAIREVTYKVFLCCTSAAALHYIFVKQIKQKCKSEVKQ